MKQPVHFVLVLTLSVSLAHADILSGNEILARVDAVLSAPRDGAGTAVLITTDKDGRRTQRSLRMWTRYFKDRDDWSLIQFTDPAEMRDTDLLRLGYDRIYLYVPAFERIVRIRPQAHTREKSFGGSGFSHDDLSTGKFANHYTAEIKKETEQEYVLELTRKQRSKRIYPKSIAWVNKQHFYITRMELFDKHMQLWKVLEAKNEQIQGYWTMTEIAVTDLRRRHRTTMRIKDIRFDVDLKDAIFTERHLRRSVEGEQKAQFQHVFNPIHP